MGKHTERRARLERIRELAVQSGKEDTVARVDKLMEKEQGRFERKMQKFVEKEQKTLQLGEKGFSEAEKEVKAESKTEEAEE